MHGIPKVQRFKPIRTQDQLVALVIGAETGLVVAFADLVVIVDHGQDFVAEPCVGLLPDLERIAEKIEVIRGIAIPLDQILELVLDVIDAQRGVKSGGLDRVKGPHPAARDLADQKKMLFANAHPELMDHRRKIPGRTVAHVLNRIHAVTIDIRKRDPKLINPRRERQGPEWGCSRPGRQAQGQCPSGLRSLSAVSEAPTSGKVSAEVLWTGASDTALEGSRPGAPGDYGICIWMSRS
jgi:hypothetical protein